MAFFTDIYGLPIDIYGFFTDIYVLLIDIYGLVWFLFRDGFLPWKRLPSKPKSTVTQRYQALEATFFLIKVRPKIDLGLTEGVPTSYLDFFVQVRFLLF
jgi:hypothetical protein